MLLEVVTLRFIFDFQSLSESLLSITKEILKNVFIFSIYFSKIDFIDGQDMTVVKSFDCKMPLTIVVLKNKVDFTKVIALLYDKIRTIL